VLGSLRIRWVRQPRRGENIKGEGACKTYREKETGAFSIESPLGLRATRVGEERRMIRIQRGTRRKKRNRAGGRNDSLKVITENIDRSLDWPLNIRGGKRAVSFPRTGTQNLSPYSRKRLSESLGGVDRLGAIKNKPKIKFRLSHPSPAG